MGPRAGGLVEGESWPGICTGPWLAGPADRADYGGIDGELRTMPQWQTIAHDLDAPGVLHGGIEVHVGQTDVLGDTMQASARSSGIARAGSTPAVAQAARWSPQGSSWPRQWQCLGANGKGRRNPRSRSTRNCALGMTTSSWVGSTLKAREECGPA